MQTVTNIRIFRKEIPSISICPLQRFWNIEDHSHTNKFLEILISFTWICYWKEKMLPEFSWIPTSHYSYIWYKQDWIWNICYIATALNVVMHKTHVIMHKKSYSINHENTAIIRIINHWILIFTWKKRYIEFQCL